MRNLSLIVLCIVGLSVGAEAGCGKNRASSCAPPATYVARTKVKTRTVYVAPRPMYVAPRVVYSVPSYPVYGTAVYAAPTCSTGTCR
jgi:hypothetical protein